MLYSLVGLYSNVQHISVATINNKQCFKLPFTHAAQKKFSYAPDFYFIYYNMLYCDGRGGCAHIILRLKFAMPSTDVTTLTCHQVKI
jgi:hypothetical protein